VDFEGEVDYTSSWSGYRRNRVRGIVTDQPPALSQNVSMQWETGKALKHAEETTHCNFDGTNCYEARTVPVIYNISSHAGWSTGGQSLDIDGSGLQGSEISVVVDGVPCKVTASSNELINC